MTFPPSDRAWMLFRGTCALFTAGRILPLLPSTPSHGRPSSARRPAPTRRSFPCGKEKRSGRRKARPSSLTQGKKYLGNPPPHSDPCFHAVAFRPSFPVPAVFPVSDSPVHFPYPFPSASPLRRSTRVPPPPLRTSLRSGSPPLSAAFLAPPFSSAALRRPPTPFPPSNTMPRRPLSLFRHALTCPEYGKSPPAP